MPRPTGPVPAYALVLPLLLLANAAGGQTLREKRFGPPAPGDTLPRAITREFELYGPTAEEVRKANDEIKVAYSQFGRYLGEQPKQLAFVLFRSADEARRYDPKPLTRRGIQIVPWLLPGTAGGSAAAAPAPGTPGAPDPLGHDVAHRFLVAYVEHAKADAISAGLAVPDTGAKAGTASSGGSPAPSPGVAIPAAHPDILVLPDWLEEAIAALCERPSLQKSRLDYMRAHLDQRIPFTELMAMRRPAPAAGKSGKASPATPKAGAAKGAGSAPPPGAERAAIFCNEALSLARFIALREEDRFVGTIVEGVLRGRTVGDVLNTSQNLMSKPEALEKQWLEWVQGAERAP